MWRHYVIIALGNGETWRIYAPSLEMAFHLARCNGGGSRTLRCEGVLA